MGELFDIGMIARLLAFFAAASGRRCDAPTDATAPPASLLTDRAVAMPVIPNPPPELPTNFLPLYGGFSAKQD
jgi:hypothetical protein